MRCLAVQLLDKVAGHGNDDMLLLENAMMFLLWKGKAAFALAAANVAGRLTVEQTQGVELTLAAICRVTEPPQSILVYFAAYIDCLSLGGIDREWCLSSWIDQFDPDRTFEGGPSIALLHRLLTCLESISVCDLVAQQEVPLASGLPLN